ncbi:MAG: SpoIIE family protein phosphatase [Thermodesulfobacteriota bacterium]
MDLHDQKPSLLIVDDSKLVLNIAVSVLRALDLPVYTAENGRQGLDIMMTKTVDLVITDLMMPVMDGFDLIARIRQEERFRQTYIIVMTALDEVADKVKALNLGANDYTVKPLDVNEFRARVQAGIRETQLKRQLSEALERLDQELKLVAALQRRFLPKSLPRDGRFESAAYYRPWSRAGGDYYDCFLDDKSRLVLVVADVSGHGASAAVLMGILRALLKITVSAGGTAAQIMSKLNRALLENIGDDPDFITLFLGLVDPERRRLNYSSAGHGDMLILGPERNRLQRLASGGTVLGCFESEWREEFLDLKSGQTLVLYTDGLIEAINSQDKEFGRDSLESFLLSADPMLQPRDLVSMIRAEVERFTQGTVFTDDVTIFLTRFL